jgi:hypothetical protein
MVDDRFIAKRVRYNVASAAIGAICLLAYGFALAGPAQIKTMFNLGDAVSVHTLRIGGVALLLVAIGSMTGKLIFLLIDAIVMIPVGLGMIVSGVLMLFGGGGFLQALPVLFGGLFVSAGLRNARDYQHLSVFSRSTSGARPVSPFAPTQLPPIMEHPAYLTERLLDRTREKPEQTRPGARFDSSSQPVEAAPARAARTIESDSPPPPGGYLAMFAKKEDEKSDER